MSSPVPLQGAASASTKSGRKAAKERIEEIKSAPAASRDYTVKFNFEAAARKLNPPLITMEKVELYYYISLLY